MTRRRRSSCRPSTASGARSRELTLTKLIEDGRIHPAASRTRTTRRRRRSRTRSCRPEEQGVFEANCGEFHEELVKILGRLRYRTSYGQNVLKHTLEVVHLAGIMAAEVGASVKVTKRAALLHDLGKAMTHEIEGSHASILRAACPEIWRVAARRARDRGTPTRDRATDGRERSC